MAKYSFDFKLKVVNDYLSGGGGYLDLAKKYQGLTYGQIRYWVNAYQRFGAIGLQRKRQNTVYDSNFKLNAVNLYLTSEKSYREVANQLGLNNPAMIARWVLDYRQKGNLAFSKSRGRPRKGAKVSNSEIKKKNSNKERSELERQLAEAQKENLYLRVENEYLKGLRRLRREQARRENPDLFKASNDDSSSHFNSSSEPQD